MVKSIDGKRHDYYEAILQLRDVSPEFVELVIREVERAAKAIIAKIKPERGGVDIYLSDQHYAQALGKTLKAQYGGELKTSKKLYGRIAKKGHIVYRVTVLFRKFRFNVGDVVTTDDGDVTVLSLDTKVRVQHLRSGKKDVMRIDQLERFVD